MSAESWLPPRKRRRRAPPDRFWEPRVTARGKPAAFGAHKYVTIDELEPTIALLLVTEWPTVDARGRLYFEKDLAILVVERASLESLLRRREPTALANRDLRIGDVFAIRFRESTPFLDGGDGTETQRVDLEKWVIPPVLDVTRDAREAAKAAYYAAVAPTITHAQAVRLEREIHAARDISEAGS